MKTRWFGGAAAFLGAIATVALCVPAAAQLGPGPGGPQGGPGQRMAPKNYNSDLVELAKDVATRFQAKVLVDTSIMVPDKPKAPSDATTIDGALDGLTRQGKSASWRKVYLNQNQSNALPPADKLAETLRALDKVEQSNVVIESPSTRRATTLMKNYPVSQTFKEDLAAGSFSTNPVYVVYCTSEAARADVGRFLDLQKQQYAMMAQMDPATLATAMQQGMNLLMSTDPQTRQQMLGTMMQAGMQMFMNMPADQRQQLMQEMMGSMGPMFGGGRGGPGGRRGPGGPGGPGG